MWQKLKWLQRGIEYVSDNIHLYSEKWEAGFKTFVITLSWYCGVGQINVAEPLSEIGTSAYYLFSLALIMEYVVTVINSHRFIRKLLPSSILCCSGLVFFSITCTLMGMPMQHVGYNEWRLLCYISMCIIWFDCVTMILFEFKDSAAEVGLKNLGEGN